LSSSLSRDRNDGEVADFLDNNDENEVDDQTEVENEDEDEGEDMISRN
jgi:hypothetical protein